MYKHIVCLKLADNTPENCQTTKELLLSMNTHVPAVKSVSVYIDELHSARSFDLMMEVLLDNAAALDIYQKDAYHCDVVKKHLAQTATQTIVLDFEI